MSGFRTTDNYSPEVQNDGLNPSNRFSNDLALTSEYPLDVFHHQHRPPLPRSDVMPPGEKEQGEPPQQYESSSNNSNGSNDYIANNLMPQGSMSSFELPGTYSNLILSNQRTIGNSDEMQTSSHPVAAQQQQQTQQSEDLSNQQPDVNKQARQNITYNSQPIPQLQNYDNMRGVDPSNYIRATPDSPQLISHQVPRAALNASHSMVTGESHQNQEQPNLQTFSTNTVPNLAHNSAKPNNPQENQVNSIVPTFNSSEFILDIEASPMTCTTHIVEEKVKPAPITTSSKNVAINRQTTKKRPNAQSVSTSNADHKISKASKIKKSKAKVGRKKQPKPPSIPSGMDINNVRTSAVSNRDPKMIILEGMLPPLNESNLEETYSLVVRRAQEVTEEEKVKSRTTRRRNIPQENKKIDPKNASRVEAALSRFRKDVFIQSLLEEIKVLLRDKQVLKKALGDWVPKVNNLVGEPGNDALPQINSDSANDNGTMDTSQQSSGQNS